MVQESTSIERTGRDFDETKSTRRTVQIDKELEKSLRKTFGMTKAGQQNRDKWINEQIQKGYDNFQIGEVTDEQKSSPYYSLIIESAKAEAEETSVPVSAIFDKKAKKIESVIA